MSKTVLITGASSGIGEQFASIFARQGYSLVLVARRRGRLEMMKEELSRRYNVKVKVMQMDLSLPGAPEEIFTHLDREGIQVNTLVNNAGTQVYGRCFDTDLEAELKLLQVNLVALFHMTKLAVKRMRTAGEGRILNVASTGGFHAVPNNACYCAAKGFVLLYSEAIAAELKGSAITVTALCPGPTRSEFASAAGIENLRLFRYMPSLSSGKVAEMGYKALVKGKRIRITGFFNNLMILSGRFLPRSLVMRVGRFLMSPA